MVINQIDQPGLLVRFLANTPILNKVSPLARQMVHLICHGCLQYPCY